MPATQQDDRRREVGDIKASLDIVETVQSYGIKITRAGKLYQGLCPFHADRDSPSLTVYSGNQSYHCFGCGEHGDVFEFIMKMERIPFKDVIARYRSGGSKFMTSPAAARPVPPAKKEKEEVDPKLLQLYSDIWEITRKTLLEDKGKNTEEVRDYLITRGFKPGQYPMLPFGAYIPELRDYIADTYDRELVMKSGLLSWGKGFNYRLVFPHYDMTGRLIGLVLRLVKDGVDREGKPLRKYKFTPGFDKSIPFNFYDALSTAKAKGEIFIVEGQLDAATLMLAGIKNVVSIGGNNLQDVQLELIVKEGIKNILLWLDNDDAGDRGCIKAIKDVIATPAVPFVVSSAFKDVGDINKAPDRMEIITTCIQTAGLGVVWLATKMSKVTGDLERQRVLEEGKVIFNTLSSPIHQQEFVKVLAKGIGYKIDHIIKHYKPVKQETPRAASVPPRKDAVPASARLNTVNPSQKAAGPPKKAVNKESLHEVAMATHLRVQSGSLDSVVTWANSYLKENRGKMSFEVKDFLMTVERLCRSYDIGGLHILLEKTEHNPHPVEQKEK